jgi:hypothetical protein
VLSLATPVLADDWVAAKAYGVFTYIDDHWVPVHRGDVVPDGQVVRTQANGRVLFVRGAEQVALSGDTQVMINDRDDKQFTTVKQWYGEVAVEAEVQNVQHFAVRTPELAAVVKGTRFVVTSGNGESSVDVQRGHVEVDDARRGYTVTVDAGQSVTTGDGTVMQVAGSGELPIVVTPAGKPVDAALIAPPHPRGGAFLGGTAAEGRGNNGGGSDHSASSNNGGGSDHSGSSNNGNGGGNSGNGGGGNSGSSGNGGGGDHSGSSNNGGGSDHGGSSNNGNSNSNGGGGGSDNSGPSGSGGGGGDGGHGGHGKG